MKRAALAKSALRPVSERRQAEGHLYRYRRKIFLSEHPYCQVWLNEHGLAEEIAIRDGGIVRPEDSNGAVAIAPLATEIHHRNKRRSGDLLDQAEWMAVSKGAHERIEANKAWARSHGYLRDF